MTRSNNPLPSQARAYLNVQWPVAFSTAMRLAAYALVATVMSGAKAFIFRVWYYYLLATGFSSLYFDFRRKRLQSPRWLCYYRLFINGALLLLLPFYYINGTVYLDDFVEKPLLATIGRFNVVAQSFVIIYTFIIRHHQDQQYCGIVQTLQHLERIYFENWQEAPSVNYSRLFYLKFFTLFSQNITLVLGSATIMEKRSLTRIDYLLNLYFFIIWNTLHTIILVYYLTLLHIVRRYDVLNIYLQRCLRWLSATPPGSMVRITHNCLWELRRILQVHGKLQALAAQMVNIYRFHITVMLLIFFFSSTAAFYIAFINLPNWTNRKVFVILSFALFAIKSFDVFLLNHCCEILVARHSEALSLLQRHQHRLHMCAEYEQLCTDFALNAALSKFSINIYGMFDMNHRATLAVLRNAVMHALILIQFDYIVDPAKRQERYISSTAVHLVVFNGTLGMQTAKRAKLRKKVLSYVNIVAVVLGIASFRLNLKKQRLDRPLCLRFYVVFANVVTLLLMPVVYIQQATALQKTHVENSLINFTDCVGIICTFTAAATTVLRRWKHEVHYARIAQAMLDKDYYNKYPCDNDKDRHSDYFLYFKTLTFSLHAIGVFYGAIQFSPIFSLRDLLLAIYYGYVYNLLNGSLFIYFCFMWLLRRRFSLLNTNLNHLLHALQPSQGVSEGALEIQQLDIFGVKELAEISKIHTQLSTLATCLTAGFKVQILAGLLTQLINGITFGYYAFLLNKKYLYIHFDMHTTILASAFTLLLFVDGSLLYWIAEATANAQRSTSQLLRRFETLPLSYEGIGQQCELFALQLKLQNENVSIASMFPLRLQTSLAMLEFTLRHILIMIQFDYQFRMLNANENTVLDTFSRLLSLNYFEHK